MANPLLKPAGSTVVRDYRHAARIFTDDNFRLSPKYGFLFYVEFDFNPLITNISNLSAQELGMIVKSVNLPKYTIDTKVHNAYNRKNIVQNKISYDPVTITFHDDQSDNVRSFWYDYYSFFFRDPDYADSTYSAPHKYQGRPAYDWGYTPKAGIGYNNANGNQPYQYIQAIRIYSLFQKNFSEYELINPTITSFKHGEHNNSGTADMLSHEMSVQFETVKYHTGYVTKDNVGGFIDLHYDNTRSPIAVEGSEKQITDGKGGVANIPSDIIDLAGINASLSQVLPFAGVSGGASSNTVMVGAAPFPSLFNKSTAIASTSGTVNTGGFSIPSLGSLSQGIPNLTSLNNSLSATAAATVGNFVSGAANKVVGSIATGIGTNGSAVIGLVTSAISNPKLFLATGVNMAVNYGVSYAANAATNALTNLTKAPLATLATKLTTSCGDVSGFFSSGGAQAYLGGWSADILSASSFDVIGSGYINTTGEIFGSLEF